MEGSANNARLALCNIMVVQELDRMRSAPEAASSTDSVEKIMMLGETESNGRGRSGIEGKQTTRNHDLPEAASSTDSVEKFMATRMKPPSPPFLGLNSSKYLSMGTASKMSFT